MKLLICLLLAIAGDPAVGQVVELGSPHENHYREGLLRLINSLKIPGITVREWVRYMEGRSIIQDSSIEISEVTTTVHAEFERKLINSNRLLNFILRREISLFSTTLITEGEHIIAAGISQEYPRLDRISRDTLIYSAVIDSTALHHLLQSWRHQYGGNVDLVADATSPYRNVVFGTKCGYLARRLWPYRTMMEGVRQTDTAMLQSWLRSMNVEIQAYGAEGLLILNAFGLPIQDKDCELIENLISSNQKILSCSGCVVEFGRWELEDLSDVSWMLANYQEFLKEE